MLIEILMVSRMLYGMGDRGWLPRALAHVWARTHAPVRATLLTGFLVLTSRRKAISQVSWPR